MVCGLGPWPIQVTLAAAELADAHHAFQDDPDDPGRRAAARAAHRRFTCLTATPDRPQ